MNPSFLFAIIVVEEFFIKTIVGNTEKADQFTIYLFNSTNTLSVPLNIDKKTLDMLLVIKQNLNQKTPSIYNATSELIKLMGGRIMHIYVDKIESNFYESYVFILNFGKIIKIKIKFTDALCLALKNNAPLYFKKEIIKSIALSL